MPPLYLCLERNIVFHVVELAGRLLRRGGLGRGRRTLAAHFSAALGARLTATFTPAEHLHRVAADLGAVAVLAGFLVLPLARSQAAFDVHLRALLQVFARDLGQAAEKRDAVPLGGFLRLAARLVFPAIGGGDANIGDGLTARQVTRLRVRAQVADDDYLVDRCHLISP